METVAEEAKRGYAHLCNSRGGKEPAYISALVPMFRNAGVGSRPCFPNMATLLLLLLRTYRERRTNVSLKRLLYVLTRAPPLRLEVTMAIPRANGSPRMCVALWRRYAPFRREYFTKIWKRKKKGGRRRRGAGLEEIQFPPSSVLNDAARFVGDVSRLNFGGEDSWRNIGPKKIRLR